MLTKDDLSVRYSLKVGVFNEDFSQHILDMYFDNVFVKFDMRLDNDFVLMVDWVTVELDKVRITPYVQLERKNIDEIHVMHYFNWMFKIIVPWANA